MKITQITFTSRKGMPSYSHEEIVAVAEIRADSDSKTQIAAVKALVNEVLYGTPASTVVAQTVVENGQTVVDKAPVSLSADKPAVSEAATAAKQTRARKATVETKEDGTVTAQMGSEPEATLNIKKEEPKAAPKVDKTVEKYDRSIKEHTSTFAAHLTKTYGDTWKAQEGLKAFSESLNGVDFRDTKTGLLVDSFKSKIEAFFGAVENVL